MVSGVKEHIGRIFQQLETGASEPRHPFHWPVLASVSPNGEARARVVVLRELTGHVATVFTDARSQKITELKAVPRATLLFYDPEARYQVRARGRATVHLGDAISRRYWESLREKQEREYQSVGEPGQPHEPGSDAVDPSLANRYFAVLRISLDFLDTLKIEQAGHLRYQFSRDDGEWSGGRVVP